MFGSWSLSSLAITIWAGLLRSKAHPPSLISASIMHRLSSIHYGNIQLSIRHQHPPPGLHCHSPYHDPRLEWRLPCRRAREAPFMEQLDGLDGYAPTSHSCDCPSRLQLRPLVMLRFDIDPYPLASVNYDSIHRRLAMRTCTYRQHPPTVCTSNCPS